jgi:hypothetical protein
MPPQYSNPETETLILSMRMVINFSDKLFLDIKIRNQFLYPQCALTFLNKLMYTYSTVQSYIDKNRILS